jgi:hypothetical protein
MSSSRRTTGEINILAMLDGQAPGRRLRTLPTVVWYGAAGVLACSLLVALAWLVRGTTPTRGADTAGTAQASAPTLQSTQPSQSSRPAPDMVASPDAAGPARGAVIIDLPQPAPATASAMPVRALAGTETTRATPRHTATHPVTPSIPSTRPQPALRTSSAQALAHADPAPLRQKRSAGPSRTTSSTATVDTDVALISALLQHTGPRNEAADGAGTAACSDKPCGPRIPPRQ